jgi:hypothetical protein
VRQATDSGYVIVGDTYTFGAGNSDIYIIKTNSKGDTIWTKTCGGAKDEVRYSIKQTYDGGYIITGYSSSYSNDHREIYVVKLKPEINKYLP